MGLSGGKSTLIRCLNRLNEPTSGKVLMIMILPARNKQRTIETRRTEMSMVFQSLVFFHTERFLRMLLWIRD
jgi:glycine betaine/proline transport system ATP-binding protein